MGEIIKKPVVNCNSFLGVYPLSFTFSDINASANNVYSAITQISTQNLTNTVYSLAGNFLWGTSSPNITGNCIITLGITTSVIYSGMVQCNKDISPPNHYVYWDSGLSGFVIQTELNNHTDAIFTFNFIFS